MYDPDLYRAKDEVERWKQHDPIAGFVERAASVLADADVEEIEREVAAELDAAVAAAEAGALEQVSELLRHVNFEGAAA